jgi:hypothetical protein
MLKNEKLNQAGRWSNQDSLNLSFIPSLLCGGGAKAGQTITPDIKLS